MLDMAALDLSVKLSWHASHTLMVLKVSQDETANIDNRIFCFQARADATQMEWKVSLTNNETMSNDHESHRRQKSLETQKLVKLWNGSVIDQPTFCHSNSYDEQPSQSCQSSVSRGKWKSIAKRPRVWVLARNQVFFFRLRPQARPRPGQSF